MAPNYFWLFLEIKSAERDEDFRKLKTYKNNVTKPLKAIPQQEFQKCFQQWS
jgi:hypothetical protein